MKELLSSTLEGLKGIADVNTIVGQAVETQNGTVIIPVSKLSMGFVAGGSDFPSSKNNNGKCNAGGGGGGVTIDPVAFLIVNADGNVRLMDLEGSSNIVANLLGAVPGLVEQLVEKLPENKKGKAAIEQLFSEPTETKKKKSNKKIQEIINEIDEI